MLKFPVKCRLIYLSQGTLEEGDVHSQAEHYRENSTPSFRWASEVEIVQIGKGTEGSTIRTVVPYSSCLNWLPSSWAAD